MTEELKHYILKNGLLLGCIYVALDIVKYVNGAEFFVNNYLNFASLLLGAIFPVYYLLQHKKSQDGFIDFIAFKIRKVPMATPSTVFSDMSNETLT